MLFLFPPFVFLSRKNLSAKVDGSKIGKNSVLLKAEISLSNAKYLFKCKSCSYISSSENNT